jgi:hypothetical protein
MTARFIVLAQHGQYVVHDNEDGSNSTPIGRYGSAVHLAAQFNRQAEQERSFSSIESSANEAARAIVRGEQR